MNNKIKIITGIALALALASCGTKGETEKNSLTSSAGSKTEQTSEASREESKTEQTSEIPNKGNNRNDNDTILKYLINSMA